MSTAAHPVVTRPSRAGLEALRRELGRRRAPRSVRTLTGGLLAVTQVLRFESGPPVVLKRYPAGSALAAREFAALELAERAGLPAPRPLALDAGGWFGTPSLAMSLVEGRADLRWRRSDASADQAAVLTARVHAVASVEVPSLLRRAHPLRGWAPPEPVPAGLLGPALARRVRDVLAERLGGVAHRARVLNHGDLHPGNLLWRRGRLCGLVDWSHARAGDRYWELAYLRCETSLLAGPEAARRLLATYEAEAGVTAVPEDLALLDLHVVLGAHRWAYGWLVGYHALGRPELTLADLGRGLRAHARDALRRAG